LTDKTLKEDLKKGANNIHHMSRIKSIHDLTHFYYLILSMTAQLNSFNDRVAEAETFSSLSKICTTKESVFEHLYKFEMVTVNDGKNTFSRGEAKRDFNRGEISFKHFLYNYDDAYLAIAHGHMSQVKADVFVDVCSISRQVRAEIGDRYIGKGHEIYDTEEDNMEANIGFYFNENSLVSQEVEGSMTMRTGGKKESKKVSKIEIPSKETKQTSVMLTIHEHPFIKNALHYFRRHGNYLSLWLQSVKMIQTMYDKTQFMGYNPDEVISYQREPILGLSRLQATVMKLLDFKYNRFGDEEGFFNESTRLFDELGSIKSILKVLPLREFKALVVKDQNYLMSKAFSDNELKFFKSLELVVFKKKAQIRTPDYPFVPRTDYEFASPDQVIENSKVLGPQEQETKAKEVSHAYLESINYLDSYIKEILLHIRKLNNVQINEINKFTISATMEKQTTEKLLNNLNVLNFDLKKKKYDFRNFVGFVAKTTKSKGAQRKELDREGRALHYDDFSIDEIQETNMFIYFSQSNKLLSTVSLKLLVACLDLDATESALLLKKSLPFYTLNNLRLAELDGILFHSKIDHNANKQNEQAGQTENDYMGTHLNTKISNSSKPTDSQPAERSLFGMKREGGFNSMARPPKFEYRKLRRYLYVLKRIELKNRSNSRGVFTFVDEIKKKMTQILDDAKLTKPDTVFNTYLNCVFENEQRSFVLALMDTIAQSRWLDNFYDLIDINLEKIRKDKELFFLTRSFIINLMFPKSSSFKIFFDIFSNTEYLRKDLLLSPEGYPYAKPKEKLLTQIYSRGLYSVIRKNNFLNLFENSIISQEEDSCEYKMETRIGRYGYLESFNSFAFSDFDHRWNNMFTQMLAFKSPQRTFISKKTYQISLAAHRNFGMPEQSILPHNLWILKILDAHRLLDLNLKNMMMFEAMNSKITNDLYCRNDKESSSVIYEDRIVNGIVSRVTRRKYTPTLLPFVRNSMFQKDENSDFARMVLRLFSLELHMTSSMEGQELLSVRYPDLLQSDQQGEYLERSEIELKIKNSIKINTVWSRDPLLTSKYNSRPPTPTKTNFSYYEEQDQFINKQERRSRPYNKDDYHDHKLGILKAITESLRQSFFLDNMDQAFNLNYLLMREFIAQAAKDQTVAMQINRLDILNKTEKCKARDSTVLALHRSMMTSIVVNSYLIETPSCGDNIVIRKSDLSKVAVNWHEAFSDTITDELRKREILYLIKVDDINLEIDNNTQTGEMIDFYFSYITAILRRVTGSRLVMRNTAFAYELDSLSRYIRFAKVDGVLAYDKVACKSDQTSRSMIRAKHAANSDAQHRLDDAVRSMKADLKAAAREEREDTVRRMK
jgi:hypothetical protein